MFDCDDTLYNLRYPFDMACHDVLYLDDPSEAMYIYYRNCGEEIFDLVQKGTVSIDESGIYRILKMCKKYDLACDEQKAKRFQAAYKEYQGKISMSPCFHTYFQNTRDEIAILTNGQDAHQRKKLETLGVFDYFDASHIFTSGALGHAKPDPRAFEIVLSSLEQEAKEWVYVGDNYKNDMQGAKQVGMQTIHFNRHHQEEGPCSDHVVYTEEELIDLLNAL